MKKLLVLFGLLLVGSSAFAQVHQVRGNFLPGYYYTKEGQRAEGLIRHQYGTQTGQGPVNQIEFKPSDKAKPVTLTTKDIQAFVLGQDSFTVQKDFDINSFDHFQEDFMRVVKSGALNLYLHYATTTFPTRQPVLTYLVEKDGEFYRMVRPKNFSEQINLLISDNKELLAKVKNKDYTFEDLQVLIDEYNLWAAQKTVKSE
ncbi:hypothetical protein [Rufibacter soli]